MKTRTRNILALSAAACVATLSTTQAMWAGTIDVPAARVISNLNARIAKNPSDATALYNLGRVHAYLVSHGGDKVPTYDGVDKPTSIPSTESVGREAKPGFADVAKHAQASIDALNKAIKLEPQRGSFKYALANVAEASLGVAAKIRTAPMLDVGVVAAEDAAAAQARINAMLAPGADVDALIAQAVKSQALFGDDASMNSIRALQWSLIRERAKADPRSLPIVNKAIAAVWRAEMIELYFEAFTLALADDSRHGEMSLRGLADFLAYQAAKDYCRLVPEAQQPKVRRDIVAAAIKSFESLPPCSAITPILVPMRGATGPTLESLLAPQSRVKFDLDGTGRGSSWSWVRPETGILVWDPTAKGAITSGRQLFGSATWWMMFENGYAALDSLDDNRDGQISGPELRGIALWFDRDGDGVSDIGEVTPIERTDVQSLATDFTGTTPDGSLISASGVRFKDGSCLPTFDWITRPLPSASHLPSTSNSDQLSPSVASTR